MQQDSLRISGALKALASDLADDIAAHFPFPHQPFFELAPARMHLLGMLITGSDREAIDFDRLPVAQVAGGWDIDRRPVPHRA